MRATTKYVRMVHRTWSVVAVTTTFLLHTVCCYMSHDRQRGEDLCSANEREPRLSGEPRQRTSCEMRIRLVDRQHASRRTKIVRFARHLERIKSDEVLALVRALHTYHPISIARASPRSGGDGRDTHGPFVTFGGAPAPSVFLSVRSNKFPRPAAVDHLVISGGGARRRDRRSPAQRRELGEVLIHGHGSP